LQEVVVPGEIPRRWFRVRSIRLVDGFDPAALLRALARATSSVFKFVGIADEYRTGGRVDALVRAILHVEDRGRKDDFFAFVPSIDERFVGR
jgi:hypothetical protein